jgi:hypothetical protein
MTEKERMHALEIKDRSDRHDQAINLLEAEMDKERVAH